MKFNLESMFYGVGEGDVFRVSREVGSKFAKNICGDYNVIHDEDSKKFVLPGDLIFSGFCFINGIPRGGGIEFVSPVRIPKGGSLDLNILNGGVEVDGKQVMKFTGCGFGSYDENFLRQYCEISGKLFPNSLKECFKLSNLMPNLKRPMVMYSGVDFKFFEGFSGDFSGVNLDLNCVDYEVKNNRLFLDAKVVINEGEWGVGVINKRLICLGLVEYKERDFLRLVDSCLGVK